MLRNLLSHIQADKWKHFYVGILMGLVLECGSFWLLQQSYSISIVVSAVLIVVISYGFELFSLISGLGHYDFKDALASIIGGLVGLGLGLGGILLFW